MASNFLISGKDLDDTYEQKKKTSVNGIPNYYLNGNKLNSRFQDGSQGYTSAGKDNSFKYYFNDTTNGALLKLGYYPTWNLFHTITSTGTTTISLTVRSVDGKITQLNVGSTAYTSSNFRNGVIPSVIGIVFCGGGSGASGLGSSAGDKNGYNRAPQCGGSGSAICSAVVNLTANDGSGLPTVKITIGAGGAGGSDSAAGDKTNYYTGGSGGNGGSSTLNINGDTLTADTVSGPGGGIGKSGYTVEAATAKSGGTYSLFEVIGMYIYNPTCVNGGPGNDWYNSNRGATSLTTKLTKDGDSKTFGGGNTGCNASSGNGYRDAWFGGGSSIGSGATNTASAGYGGGGSTQYRNGGNGVAYLYY